MNQSKKRRKLTRIMRMHYLKLFLRSLLFLGALGLYITNRLLHLDGIFMGVENMPVILSVIWLSAGGYPLSVFANEFVSSTLPMILYFVGKTAKERTGIWYRNYLYAMLLLGVLGVVLYIACALVIPEEP